MKELVTKDDLEPSTKKNIKAVAKEISEIANQFRLAHLTNACDKYLKNYLRELVEEDYNQIHVNYEKEISRNGKDTSEAKRLYEDMVYYNTISSYRIVVNYSEHIPVGKARVSMYRGMFEIALPRELQKQIIKDDNEIDINALVKLQEAIAHEIGHLALHTKLIEIGKDSSNIKGEKEAEANYFTEELLELEKQRNLKFKSLYGDAI